MKLFAFCFLFAAIAAAECPAGMTAVPLRTIDRFLTIPVSINGESPHDFVLDTGAQVTTLDPEIAHGTPEIADVSVLGTKGHVAGYMTRVDSITVGKATLSHQQAAVMPLNGFSVNGKKISGILGKDFLSNFDILIQHGKTVCIK